MIYVEHRIPPALFSPRTKGLFPPRSSMIQKTILWCRLLMSVLYDSFRFGILTRRICDTIVPLRSFAKWNIHKSVGHDFFKLSSCRPCTCQIKDVQDTALTQRQTEALQQIKSWASFELVRGTRAALTSVENAHAQKLASLFKKYLPYIHQTKNISSKEKAEADLILELKKCTARIVGASSSQLMRLSNTIRTLERILVNVNQITTKELQISSVERMYRAEPAKSTYDKDAMSVSTNGIFELFSQQVAPTLLYKDIERFIQESKRQLISEIHVLLYDIFLACQTIESRLQPDSPQQKELKQQEYHGLLQQTDDLEVLYSPCERYNLMIGILKQLHTPDQDANPTKRVLSLAMKEFKQVYPKYPLPKIYDSFSLNERKIHRQTHLQRSLSYRHVQDRITRHLNSIKQEIIDSTLAQGCNHIKDAISRYSEDLNAYKDQLSLQDESQSKSLISRLSDMMMDLFFKYKKPDDDTIPIISKSFSRAKQLQIIEVELEHNIQTINKLDELMNKIYQKPIPRKLLADEAAQLQSIPIFDEFNTPENNGSFYQ